MAGCLGAVATSADPAADGPSLLRALDFGGYNLRAYIELWSPASYRRDHYATGRQAAPVMDMLILGTPRPRFRAPAQDGGRSAGDREAGACPHPL